MACASSVGGPKVLSLSLDEGEASTAGNRLAEPSLVQVGDDEHRATWRDQCQLLLDHVDRVRVMAAAVPSVVTERVPPRHDEVIRRRTAEMIHRCVSELAQQRRRGGERLLRDQLDEDLRPVLAQQRRSAAQHAHLHAFHVDLEKRDWKGGQRGRQFSEQIVESPKLDALAGRRRRARYHVARADVAVVLVAQGHHAGRVGVADADGYDGGAARSARSR